jgi:hypothetical protein
MKVRREEDEEGRVRALKRKGKSCLLIDSVRLLAIKYKSVRSLHGPGLCHHRVAYGIAVML